MSRSSQSPSTPQTADTPVIDDAGNPTTGRCEVTGKVVGTDELVVFQGLTVCAEGKDQLLERLRRGEGLPIGALERPDNRVRLRAWVLDWCLLMTVTTVAAMAAVGPTVYSLFIDLREVAQSGDPMDFFFDMLQRFKDHPMPLALTAVILAVFYFLYYLLMHHWRGQTIGKKLMRLKVVADDGARPTFKALLRREFFHTGLIVAYTVLGLAIVLIHQTDTAITAVFIGDWCQRLVLLVSGILLWTDHQAQLSLHDRIAHTRVVKTS